MDASRSRLMHDEDSPPREDGSYLSSAESETDVYDDEEVPTMVLVIIGALAVLTAVLYLSLGGGHSHFH